MGSDSEALLRSPYSPSGILRQALPKTSADRVWEVVAIDEFRLEEQTQPEFEADPVVFLNHGALKGESLPERSHWVRIGMFKENPLSLHAMGNVNRCKAGYLAI